MDGPRWFFQSSIYAIAQTPGGYLWMGTEFGVIRFDGVRSVERQAPNGEHLPGGRVRSLLAAHDGRLWIGTDKGLASWNDGKLTQYAELAGEFVLSLLQDHEGTIWAAAWGWEAQTAGSARSARIVLSVTGKTAD